MGIEHRWALDLRIWGTKAVEEAPPMGMGTSGKTGPSRKTDGMSTSRIVTLLDGHNNGRKTRQIRKKAKRECILGLYTVR